MEICLPPLRQRTQDIPLLCDYYLDYFCQKYSRQLTLRTDDIQQFWLTTVGRSNVRELCHGIERAVILSEGAELQVAHLLPQAEPFSSQQTSQTSLPAEGHDSEPNFNLIEQEQRTILA